MKIISPFKDYYDYMAYIYGIDDKHVYFRPKTFTLPDSVVSTNPDFPQYQQIPISYSHMKSDVHMGILVWESCNRFYDLYDPLIISFCGYPIPVIFDKQKEKYSVATADVWAEIHSNIYKDPDTLKRCQNLLKLYQNTRFNKQNMIPQFKTRSNSLIKLSRLLKQPVFIAPSFKEYPKGIHSESTIVTFASLEIPMLSKYGFTSVLSPEQAYQELDYFIGNLMNESPDLDPPVEVSDKDKIVQHGFDLKTSFRGK